MWKTALLSKIRAHKILAIILTIIAAASTTAVVYTFTVLQSVACPSNTISFLNATMPPRTVYQLVPPGRAVVCISAQVTGRLPIGGLSLAPVIGLYTTNQNTSTFSACPNPWTNCGGVTVSASPARTFFPGGPVRVAVTIDAPSGSTRGVYWVEFSGCSGAMIWLRIGALGQTLQSTSNQASACPLLSWEMTITFNSYTGMIPVYQNGTSIVPP